MNILIVGAGVVGEALAEQLSLEGHQVAIVDRDRRKTRELGDKLDVLTVCGNAGMPSILKRAGIRSAEMVIAVTDVDEVNLVVGMLAARFNVKHRVVRIRNNEFVQDDGLISLKDLGIDHIINPDPTIVDALVRMIEIPGSHSIATLAGGQVLMLGFDIAPDSPAAGTTLAELREVANLIAFLVLYISRNDQLIVPKGGDRIEPGDKVYLLVSADTVELLLPFIHQQQFTMNEVIITGASRIGIQLAESLEGRVNRVVLIEPDEEIAEEAANRLKKTTVLNGEETDLDVLEEAGVDHCDLFCALSNDDQRNMLAALLAKKHSPAKAAALVHQPEYLAVMDSLGVEIVINPRLVTVGEILMYIRRGHIHSVTRLARGQAEIIEMEAAPDSPAVKSPLKNIKFPKNAIIGAIVRDGEMRIPTGETRIEPGETVVVFALSDAIPQIEKLFSRRKWL